jgi:four helix bundle protein
MRNFKELKIWQKGFDIAINCFKLTEDFPSEQKFALISQINRSGVSIPSNIAEGSSRSSEKDYNRFLEISLGSCFELETQLLISQAIKYGDDTVRNKILANIDEEEKMIMSFMNKLNK